MANQDDKKSTLTQEELADQNKEQLAGYGNHPSQEEVTNTSSSTEEE